jgi:hypothetical protein
VAKDAEEKRAMKEEIQRLRARVAWLEEGSTVRSEIITKQEKEIERLRALSFCD